MFAGLHHRPREEFSPQIVLRTRSRDPAAPNICFCQRLSPTDYNTCVSSDPRAPQYHADEDLPEVRSSGEELGARGEKLDPSSEKRIANSEKQNFSLGQRFLLSLISWATYAAISLIGRTLRYSISWEEPPPLPDATHEKQVIYSFWHRAVFPSAWLWRRIGIAVMVSRSFDGEYIARTIEKLGFIAIRGSSSRGGAPALLSMKRELERGNLVAFTIDGPRGPKYVAKPGPVGLSRATSLPMAAFYVALDNPWVLNTWDQLVIPKPFSKALVRFSTKMWVPSEAGDEAMEMFHRELQASLDRVTAFAEANVSLVGSSEFPILPKA
jgi:lysophospholipid acyltransferase (LPLAT)-like uncharacterized protein